MQPVIYGAVEGITDKAVLSALIQAAGGDVGDIYVKNGKTALKQQLANYNRAAVYQPWCVLLDLDRDDTCPVTFITQLLPSPEAHMCVRVAVREIEAWLLADPQRLSAFLSVSQRRIPGNVEAIPDPKATLINLARSSRNKAIKADMVPTEGSGRSVVPAYAARIIEFVRNAAVGWRPWVAAQHAESLHRCLQCLQKLVTHHPYS